MKNPDSQDKCLYFSLIVPAHQEEKYIGKTIHVLQEMDYPRDRFEVIIVENGSQDKTAEIIRADSPDWFSILYCPEPSVSKAKNMGIEHICAESDWVIFLDADVLLEKSFLIELDSFLHEHGGVGLGCGMVSLRPDPDYRSARAWYSFYNFANRVTHTSRSIQLIRRDLLQEFRFNEALTFDEDTFLLRQCEARSKYFFMKTDKVFASIRRFESKGWIPQLAQWIYFASRSYERKKRIQYEVVR